MKKLFTFLAVIATIATFAQAPQGFNYQATVRNSSGALVTNQNVYFKFNLMLNSATSVPVFSETHYVPTDDLGQVNLVIGTGTATTGTFSTINWGTGNYYLGIELNVGGGYVAMGTTQLLSVPYALYANSAGNSQSATPNLAAVLAVNNGANNLQITNLAEPINAKDAVTKNYVDNKIPNGTNLGDVLTWNGTSWIISSNNTADQLPQLSTIMANGITPFAANSGATITSDGGFSIVSKGVCWSTTPNPTTSNYFSNNGTGAGSFISSLTNLLPGTTYYYRAYATNTIGTGYGMSYTFTTNDFATLTTTLSLTTRTSAASGGNITSDGGAAVTARGVCWSTSPNPTVDISTITVDGSGIDVFSSFITSLTPATTYYVRAYAINAAGTSYGNEITFTTKVGFEGIYRTVDAFYYRIGVQTYSTADWPAETTIEAVDATTYKVIGYLGAFPNHPSWYFTIVNDVIDIPLTYGGSPQLGNSRPFISCSSNPADMALVNCASSNVVIRDDVNGKDRLKMSFGYYTPGSGPRVFYQDLELIVN